MKPRTDSSRGSRSRTTILVLWCLAVVALYFVVEHRAHVFGVLPYLVLLACPVMHLFMHRHHGGRSAGPSKQQ